MFHKKLKCFIRNNFSICSNINGVKEREIFGFLIDMTKFEFHDTEISQIQILNIVNIIVAISIQS